MTGGKDGPESERTPGRCVCGYRGAEIIYMSIINKNMLTLSV